MSDSLYESHRDFAGLVRALENWHFQPSDVWHEKNPPYGRVSCKK